mmetsp:Transcript_14641/g.22585  ORF Transcript_14641/g.22585 Transcript_14641/m.22585 type:complete len:702 (+) Transcript_14641:53-2158(+)
MADIDTIREDRERNGRCPSCGNRLYQITGGAVGSGVMSKMNMFKRNKNQAAASNMTMTPLTIPGSVERGQCLRCKDSRAGVMMEGIDDEMSYVVAMPTVQAVAVVAKPTLVNMDRQEHAADRTNEQLTNHDNRKQPPELDLLEMKQPPPGVFTEVPAVAAAAAAAARKESDASDSSDDLDDEEAALLEFALCNIDSDDLASSMTLETSKSGADLQALINDDLDDRKPAAKPVATQRDIDLSFLESTTTSERKEGSELKCPSGMSPEVFYQLPPEMQKELSDNYENNSTSIDDNVSSSSTEIDAETLASLPEHIRKEVLEEQAKKKQSSATAIDSGAHDRRKSLSGTKLSTSTTQFLSHLDINEDDFENLPQEVKNDLMENKRQSERDDITNLDDELNAGFDPETLASLPQDVREEVLENARKEKEDRRKKESRRTVGAHSVNVPAGYDPDAFEALPEEMRQELLEDAARQAQNRGVHRAEDFYDDEDVANAMTVNAEPVRSNMMSCTYKGEYNVMGKRHGDGEMTWKNGDKYVGKFKNGYIEGRGTMTFRDNTEYSGLWKKNKFHGEGTRRFHNGNVYNGNYTEGKRQGQGKCYFANGDMYVGDWKNDTIHGFGRYYYNNGHSFEGMFRDGKRNGRGKYQLTDGKVEIYRYVNDCRKGDGVRWSSNRKKAWRMNGGKAIKRISLEEAAQIAKRLGPQVEPS